MNEILDHIWEILAVGGMVGIMLTLFGPVSRVGGGRGVIHGILKIKHRQYEYVLGDHLLRYASAGEFSGMEITLPKHLPHIFLDAHANDRGFTRPVVFAGHNEVRLEGDFNKHFQVYAPKSHKQLALSILSPDVLRTLLSLSKKFDIEISENRLRIMAADRLTFNEPLQQELERAAGAVLAEIDHRLQSWNEASLVGDTMLDVRTSRVVKLGQVYVTKQAVGCFVLSFVPAMALWIWAVHLLNTGQTTVIDMRLLVACGLACFPGMYFVLRWTVRWFWR